MIYAGLMCVLFCFARAWQNHKRKMTEIFGGVVRHLGQKQGQILNGKDVVDLVASKREVFHSVSVNYSYGRTW